MQNTAPRGQGAQAPYEPVSVLHPGTDHDGGWLMVESEAACFAALALNAQF
jgi:hypothetical protein